jgi:amino-acid N-acetyltransferase
MLDAKTPRRRGVEGKQSKHDRFRLSMNIHAATPTDLPEILALLRSSDLPVAGIERHIATTLVARDSGSFVGCAAVEVYGAAGLLRSIAVAGNLRGEGLGQRLTEAALELARRRGVRDIYLLTTTAENFFPRFGFVPIPRDQLDPALGPSEELRGACPASAVAMRANLSTSSPSSRQSSAPPPAPQC